MKRCDICGDIVPPFVENRKKHECICVYCMGYLDEELKEKNFIKEETKRTKIRCAV